MKIIERYEALKSILSRQGPSSGFETDEREQAVRDIITEVSRRGDTALYEYTRRFDGVILDTLEVSKEQIVAASNSVDSELLTALKIAADRISSYHTAQRDSLLNESVRDGLGWLVRPLKRVGIITPGFTSPLPSSLLMAAVPAKVAGVKEIIVVTPPQKNGAVHPATLTAANIAGVDRVFSVGGAQAVAALAYGTETIPAVDKIFGPGNIYVTLAKKLLYGVVGIDGLFGPSEVVIIADDGANPAYCASDLLAQAEHTSGSAIMLTTSWKMAHNVRNQVEEQLEELSNKEEAAKNIEEWGMIGLVESIDDAIELANLYAPEHLLMLVENAGSYLEKINAAGCVIIGEKSTVALGDYSAGPAHILPTGGTARFGSPLNVTDFVKLTSLIDTDKIDIEEIGKAAQVIAETEGLDAHAKAVKNRLGG
ncbi:MAG: histidinol dehydrogenase [Dehalococcoidales bacterium]|nr:MAG: histidinol dehydrogenase [Dehalococcoidales bacterium]